MEDLKLLNDILLDSTYKNKVLLEIQLNKVSDKRLVIGLLTTIFSKLKESPINLNVSPGHKL